MQTSWSLSPCERATLLWRVKSFLSNIVKCNDLLCSRIYTIKNITFLHVWNLTVNFESLLIRLEKKTFFKINFNKKDRSRRKGELKFSNYLTNELICSLIRIHAHTYDESLRHLFSNNRKSILHLLMILEILFSHNQFHFFYILLLSRLLKICIWKNLRNSTRKHERTMSWTIRGDSFGITHLLSCTDVSS